MTYGNGYLQDIHIDDIVDWKRLQDEWAEGDYESSLDILNPNNYSNLISKYVSAEYINNLTDRLYLREITSDPSFKQDRIQVSETPPSLLNGEVYFQEQEKSCLTFSSLEWFTLATNNSSKNWDGTLEWSTDTENWNEWDGTTTLSAAMKDRSYFLYMRGTGNTVISGKPDGRWWVLTGDNIRCDGDIRTLLQHDDVENTTMANYCFSSLFFRTPLVSAPMLPATTLADYCYEAMFLSCSSLTSAPALPATTLAHYCYSQMFHNCSNLVVAPTLPATTLAEFCYRFMFSECTSLVAPPALPALKAEFHCYESMFQGCTSLVAAPALPATSLVGNCYYNMFRDCTALTTIPALPSVSLYWRSYGSMFQGCTGIKLSSTQNDVYTTPYRIPSSGTGTLVSFGAMSDMFTDTGGTFTGTPEINTTYYTSNTIV